MGTLAYMSPEQVRGETAIPASDIFLAGLRVVEMAMGRPAFVVRPSAVETMAAILRDTPPRIDVSSNLTASSRAAWKNWPTTASPRHPPPRPPCASFRIALPPTRRRGHWTRSRCSHSSMPARRRYGLPVRRHHREPDQQSFRDPQTACVPRSTVFPLQRRGNRSGTRDARVECAGPANRENAAA